MGFPTSGPSKLHRQRKEQPNPWDSLKQGDKEPGLSILQERHKHDPSASHVMELGVGYLWIGDYRAAEQHFQQASKTHFMPGDSFYGMAGVSRWCASDPITAVRYWQDGLDAPYAGAAGLGIRLSLLLLVASILNPHAFQRKRAEEILLRKSKDPRAANWPGSLARFVLRQDSNIASILDFRPWPISALEEAERKRREEADLKSREWLTGFYGRLLEFHNGSISPAQFREFMHGVTDISTRDSSNEHYFLSLIWREEFFIARYEASLTTRIDKEQAERA